MPLRGNTNMYNNDYCGTVDSRVKKLFWEADGILEAPRTAKPSAKYMVDDEEHYAWIDHLVPHVRIKLAALVLKPHKPEYHGLGYALPVLELSRYGELLVSGLHPQGTGLDINRLLKDAGETLELIAQNDSWKAEYGPDPWYGQLSSYAVEA